MHAPIYLFHSLIVSIFLPVVCGSRVTLDFAEWSHLDVEDSSIEDVNASSAQHGNLTSLVTSGEHVMANSSTNASVFVGKQQQVRSSSNFDINGSTESLVDVHTLSEGRSQHFGKGILAIHDSQRRVDSSHLIASSGLQDPEQQRLSDIVQSWARQRGFDHSDGCALTASGYYVGCKAACSCSLFQQCFPKYVMFNSDGEVEMNSSSTVRKDVGVCGITIGLMIAFSIGFFVLFLSVIVSVRMYLQYREGLADVEDLMKSCEEENAYRSSYKRTSKSRRFDDSENQRERY